MEPNNAVGYGTLGACHLYERQPKEAIQAFDKAIHLAPDVAEHEHNLGLAYLMAHQHGRAIPHFRRAIELNPGNPNSYSVLASAYSLFGMAGKSIECLSEGLSVIPNSSALHVAAAAAFAMIRNEVAAEAHYRRALELSSGTRGAFATWLLNTGKFSQANAIFEQMILDDSDPAFAYYGIMQSYKLTESDSVMVTKMEKLLEGGRLRSGSEMYLQYALGRAAEQQKNYQKAMSHFNAANRLAYAINHAGHPTDPEEFPQQNVRVKGLYEALVKQSEPGNSNATPIFIIGMIRSGTTLLDQILSSHPSVASGGELRFWIEETLRIVATDKTPTGEELVALSEEYIRYIRLLADDAVHITDKMPLNFAYAGVIHTALPNARLIHIRRNPIDTCLSIYTTYFGKGALFAYNKQNIVAYYKEYLRMMDYWRAQLPSDRLLEIDYEELISNPDLVIPKVIEFCGLPWDEACLHHDLNQSAINTPSRWQARQPLYSSSIAKWKKYEPWLEEFADLK
jgi:tetratricopeptide (TPR) repeat protein